MALANRLAQLDRELDAFHMPPEALEEVRTRSLASDRSDLSRVDTELKALAADVAALAGVLDAARQHAASRRTAQATDVARRDERSRKASANVTLGAKEAAVQRPTQVERPNPTPTPNPPSEAAHASKQEQAGASQEATRTIESAPEAPEAFGTELFGDLDAGAFDAPQDSLDDVVSSDDNGAPPSAFVDLASVLEHDEARVASGQTRGDSETTDLLNAVVARASEEPAQPAAEATSRSMPPPLRRSQSLSPPTQPTVAQERASVSPKNLSDEMDMMDVEDFEVVTENGTDGPADVVLMDQGLSDAEVATPGDAAEADQQSMDPEKKGNFFKKLFR